MKTISEKIHPTPGRKDEMATSIEKNLPHKVSEVICLKCLNRWIAVRPETVHLKALECECGKTGYVIETGES